MKRTIYQGVSLMLGAVSLFSLLLLVTATSTTQKINRQTSAQSVVEKQVYGNQAQLDLGDGQKVLSNKAFITMYRKSLKKETYSKELLTVDQSSGKAIPGAVYEAKAENGETQKLTADETGQVSLTKLAKGQYVIRQVKAPLGYELSEETVELVIENQTVIQRIFTNQRKENTILLIKITDENEPLAGVAFTLYQDEKVLRKKLETNQYGQLAVDGLTKGEYYFVETNAPKEYQIDSRKLAFTIGGEAK